MAAYPTSPTYTHTRTQQPTVSWTININCNSCGCSVESLNLLLMLMMAVNRRFASREVTNEKKLPERSNNLCKIHCSNGAGSWHTTSHLFICSLRCRRHRLIWIRNSFVSTNLDFKINDYVHRARVFIFSQNRNEWAAGIDGKNCQSQTIQFVVCYATGEQTPSLECTKRRMFFSFSMSDLVSGFMDLHLRRSITGNHRLNLKMKPLKSESIRLFLSSFAEHYPSSCQSHYLLTKYFWHEKHLCPSRTSLASRWHFVYSVPVLFISFSRAFTWCVLGSTHRFRHRCARSCWAHTFSLTKQRQRPRNNLTHSSVTKFSGTKEEAEWGEDKKYCYDYFFLLPDYVIGTVAVLVH